MKGCERRLLPRVRCYTVNSPPRRSRLSARLHRPVSGKTTRIKYFLKCVYTVGRFYLPFSLQIGGFINVKDGEMLRNGRKHRMERSGRGGTHAGREAFWDFL